ncbi:uncharacterized protein LOC133897763 isoform X2 [Phragmites australis]|uniref:uncharacterized protein LOC133897763 isoform X2 n=1 Tax=Phragmites australis TaxID=29695 RepID=UPI002D776AB9|nr:uncharacterized protein LOC133897763 isoform X2 [Phragmites australis]
MGWRLQDVAGPGLVEGFRKSAKKQLEEKSALYRFLWQELVALEAGPSGAFKGPFLTVADDKAGTLDTKIMAEANLHFRRRDIQEEVAKRLGNASCKDMPCFGAEDVRRIALGSFC